MPLLPLELAFFVGWMIHLAPGDVPGAGDPEPEQYMGRGVGQFPRLRRWKRQARGRRSRICPSAISERSQALVVAR